MINNFESQNFLKNKIQQYQNIKKIMLQNKLILF